MITLWAATAILLGAGLWSHLRRMPVPIPVARMEPSRTGAGR
ncbi:hypothetical protein SJ05684_c03050 [Sinorhizobium sojae CCBAU 05684]|uniref:Uncharacterized protein n=1 Tax=Sinorhizobium sojae CCBAU 05684 TaxID=716928 RepID=A0A249P767_9HYPH|nr:hypothetical protein SJ05684_c03050 [Sinorhizobium sojae CCBAU 05684]